MAINLDPSAISGPSTAGRIARQDAQARQDRWMSELERAQFSSSAKKDAGTRHGSRQDAAQEPDMERSAARHAERSDAARAVGPQRLAAISGLARQADTRMPLAAVPAFGLSTIGMPMPQPVVAPGTVVSVSASEGAPAAAADRAAHVAARGPAMAGQLASATGETVPGPAAEEAQAPAGQQAGEAVDFEQRLMHLHVRDGAVHAYVRDAGLGEAQIRAVALAMSAQFAADGQTLAALTVNGKRVDSRPSAPAADDLIALADDQHQAPLPSPYHHLSTQKGRF